MRAISRRRRGTLVVSDRLGGVHEASVRGKGDARLPVVKKSGAACADAGHKGNLDPRSE